MASPAISRLERVRIAAQRWALRRLAAADRRPRPANLVTGERGELEALFFLRLAGYMIVERRWRSREVNGDLDLIAWDGDVLCFIEVKARTRRDLTPAASAIDFSKKQTVRRMAEAYRRTLPAATRYNTLVRFDVVSVYLLKGEVQCELFRDAFPSWQTTYDRSGV